MASSKRSDAEKISQEIAQILQGIREDADISRKKLAQHVGCTTTTITRIEEGEQVPGIELFGTICLSLGKTPSVIFQTAENSVLS